MKKKILLIITAILVIIQLIRPARNKSTGISQNDITRHYEVPDSVLTVLKTSCYDCHSNNTHYPWYTNIQPVGWWMQYHVNEGKRELNFSEFASYTPKKQHHKLEEVAELVKEDEMPLTSYTLIHRNAIISTENKEHLFRWTDSLRNEIAQKNNLEAEARSK